MRPYLTAVPAEETCLTVFGGWRHSPSAAPGEWYGERNMTALDYPAAGVRRARAEDADLRGCTLQNACGVLARDDYPVVCYEDGSIGCNGNTLTGLLETRNGRVPEAMLPKRMVSAGARVCIFPDKVWLNAVELAALGEGQTLAPEHYGFLGNSVSVDAAETFSFRLCGGDGVPYAPDSCGPEPPGAPADGVLWLDTAPLAEGGHTVLKRYSAALRNWQILEKHLLITASSTDITQGFSEGDCIRIRLHAAGDAQSLPPLPGTEAVRIVRMNAQAAQLTVAFPFDAVWAAAPVTGVIAREVPDMDFVTECGGRLWGCRYGVSQGAHRNMIYASAADDIRNWQRFDGTPEASFAAPLSSAGPFTGAVTFNGSPLFFKEHCLEKVLLSDKGAHSVVRLSCDGIPSGSADSLTVIGGTLYYRGCENICAYTGARPAPVEGAPALPAGEARGARCGTVWYLSVTDAEGVPVLVTYDTARKLWHREDRTRFALACTFGGMLYFRDSRNRSLRIGGVETCGNVLWHCETGNIGMRTAGRKRLRSIGLRLETEPGAEAKILIEYDSNGIWHERAQLHANRLHSVVLPVAGLKCDHLRLRLEGCGGMRLYSMTYRTEASGTR